MNKIRNTISNLILKIKIISTLHFITYASTEKRKVEHV